MPVTVMARLLRRALPRAPGVPMPSRGRDLARRHLPPVVRRAAIRVTGGRLTAQEGSDGADSSKAPPTSEQGTDRSNQPERPHQPDQIVEVLRRGGTLAEALVTRVRAEVTDGRPTVAVAVASSLRGHPDTAEMGDLA